MVDGLYNSVVESDVVPLPNAPLGSAENFAGNAFVVQEKILKEAREGAREYDFERDRRWSVVNRNAKPHYSSGAAPGYVIGMKGAAARLLARDGGWVARRASFAANDTSLWVIKDKESADGSRLWPAGKYVPQTRDHPEESVCNWVKDSGSIDNEDIVLFLTLGTTHIPRPEDWPVMPVEHLRVTFKPQSFFEMNPALDVPAANDSKSRSAFGSDDSGKGCCE